MKWLATFLTAICSLGCFFMLENKAIAQQENVIYSFGYADAEIPEAAPVFDSAGNLYGTSIQGGAHGRGAIFQLTPSNGGWTENVIYDFCPKVFPCPDGATPYTSLTVDAQGNLYGTALGGNSGCGNNGCGVVFKLTNSGGTWTESVLYTFSGGDDGAWPPAGVVFDGKGNLYGTTQYGGTGTCNIGIVPGCGTVFELSPTTDREWTEQVLYSFQGLDGDTPMAGVILDQLGNIYGTTAGASPTDPGLVFRLRHTASGWKENVLYRFTGGADGNSPQAGVIFDKASHLYGTTRYGGTGTCNAFGYNGCGTAFELLRSNGGIKEKVLHSFQGGTSDGADPAASLTFDTFGGLDGTAAEGGFDSVCCGAVFRLTRTARGVWHETILHFFGSTNGDGAYPLGSLISDDAGNLYSTTQYGGANNEGSVFEITK